jgi:quercetin dioxygenase-like cupin family protein
VTAVGAVPFQAAQLEDLVALTRAAPDGYVGNVLRSGLLSVGLYRLAAGATDPQTPHIEDEVSYAVRGQALLKVGTEDHPVRPGSLLFVPAQATHFFHEIQDELVLVVFWAPPEGSAA